MIYKCIQIHNLITTRITYARQMYALVPSLCLVFTLVAGSIATVPFSNDCCPDVCVLDDLGCVTNGALELYKRVVCPLLDPLKIDQRCKITDYELINIIIKGLCDCKVKKGVMKTNSQTYEQHLCCPKLNMKYEFQLSDACCSEPIQVKVELEVCDYEVTNSGSYGIYVNKLDNMPHFYVQSVCTIVKLVGVVKYTLTATCKGEPITINHPDDAVLQDLYVIIKKAMELVMIAHDKEVAGSTLGDVFPANN